MSFKLSLTFSQCILLLCFYFGNIYFVWGLSVITDPLSVLTLLFKLVGKFN